MNILPSYEEINQNKRFIIKEIDTSKLFELYSKSILRPAFCQNCVNEEKIVNLLKSFNDYGDIIHNIRNELTFCVYTGEDKKYEYYNIDGQHRMHMGFELLKLHKVLKFNVKFIYCISTDEIKTFFDELNHDSERKPYNINSNYFLCDLRNLLEDKYKQYFASTITKNSHLYTVVEFVAILQELNIDKYIDKKGYVYARNFLDDIVKFNKKYNSVVNDIGYTEMKNKHDNPKKIFYNDEIKILDKNECITIGFKRNNFLTNTIDDEKKRGWFFRPKSIVPLHNVYKERESINAKLKKEIWEKEFLELYDDDEFNFDDEQTCPVYKCKNIITFNTCDLGHKISRANGGNCTKNNLRPICKSCNIKMSDTNWSDYEKIMRLLISKNKINNINNKLSHK